MEPSSGPAFIYIQYQGQRDLINEFVNSPCHLGTKTIVWSLAIVYVCVNMESPDFKSQYQQII